jgi:hypothetical protein
MPYILFISLYLFFVILLLSSIGKPPWCSCRDPIPRSYQSNIMPYILFLMSYLYLIILLLLSPVGKLFLVLIRDPILPAAPTSTRPYTFIINNIHIQVHSAHAEIPSPPLPPSRPTSGQGRLHNVAEKKIQATAGGAGQGGFTDAGEGINV